MDKKIGTPRRRASSKASSPHSHQSTGLCACCNRYGEVASTRRLLTPRSSRSKRALALRTPSHTGIGHAPRRRRPWCTSALVRGQRYCSHAAFWPVTLGSLLATGKLHRRTGNRRGPLAPGLDHRSGGCCRRGRHSGIHSASAAADSATRARRGGFDSRRSTHRDHVAASSVHFTLAQRFRHVGVHRCRRRSPNRGHHPRWLQLDYHRSCTVDPGLGNVLESGYRNFVRRDHRRGTHSLGVDGLSRVARNEDRA